MSKIISEKKELSLTALSNWMGHRKWGSKKALYVAKKMYGTKINPVTVTTVLSSAKNPKYCRNPSLAKVLTDYINELGKQADEKLKDEPVRKPHKKKNIETATAAQPPQTQAQEQPKPDEQKKLIVSETIIVAPEVVAAENLQHAGAI